MANFFLGHVGMAFGFPSKTRLFTIKLPFSLSTIGGAFIMPKVQQTNFEIRKRGRKGNYLFLPLCQNCDISHVKAGQIEFFFCPTLPLFLISSFSQKKSASEATINSGLKSDPPSPAREIYIRGGQPHSMCTHRKKLIISSSPQF